MTKEQKEDFLQYLKALRLIQADDFYREGLDIAISALKGEWIPCSERLPEEGETVLVCYQTQGGIAQSVCEWFDMPNRGIVWSTLGGRNPIAWQPLPEPYKAESEE